MRSAAELSEHLSAADNTAAANLLRFAMAAIDSVDPAVLVRAAIQNRDGALAEAIAGSSAISVLALGKAAIKMAQGADEALGSAIANGLVISDAASDVPGWTKLMVADHPIPDERSVRAAGAALEFAGSLAPDHLLLALVSGGGSSLMEAPHAGLELEDVRDVTDQLIRSRAPIGTINQVRSRLSSVKAGRLAAHCTGKVVTLALADVIGSDPRLVASGPTVSPGPEADPVETVFISFGVEGAASERVLAFLAASTVDPVPTGRFPAVVVGDGRTAGEAAVTVARNCGHPATYVTDRLSGDACEAARDALAKTPRGSIGVLTGETTVGVVGSGKGGRNQHAALTAAIEIAGTQIRFVACGTDGVDGPTDAAGAYVDGTTVRDPAQAQAHLNDCNAYPYLESAGSLLRTGRTGTNVGDLWLVDKTGVV